MFEKLKAWWAKERAKAAASRDRRRQEDQEARQRWRCRYKVWQDENDEWRWMAYCEGIKRSPIPEYIPHSWGGEKFEVIEGTAESESHANVEGRLAKESMLTRWEAKERKKNAAPRT